MNNREFIAQRAAKFFEDGDLVNLGIGMPTLCLNFLPEDVDVWVQSENGVIGLNGTPKEGDDVNIDIVDASGTVSTMRVGGCCFDSFTSFGLIRGGHVAVTVLGAYEVDQEGNLANWMVPGKPSQAWAEQWIWFPEQRSYHHYRTLRQKRKPENFKEMHSSADRRKRGRLYCYRALCTSPHRRGACARGACSRRYS
jgi:hypothetical protein